jgi:hypothetical protein
MPGLLGFLFGTYRGNYYERIRCLELHEDVTPDEYHMLCNLGCGSFRDNNPTTKKV